MEKYLTPEEVTKVVPGVTETNLAARRFQGLPPRFYKPTPKTVIYAESDIIQWLEDSARTQTGEAMSA